MSSHMKKSSCNKSPAAKTSMAKKTMPSASKSKKK